MTKFAWLLETKEYGAPVYWGIVNGDRLTFDPNKAAHFSDKRSAEMVIETLDDRLNWKAEEHGFDDGKYENG